MSFVRKLSNLSRRSAPSTLIDERYPGVATTRNSLSTTPPDSNLLEWLVIHTTECTPMEIDLLISDLVVMCRQRLQYMQLLLPSNHPPPSTSALVSKITPTYRLMILTRLCHAMTRRIHSHISGFTHSAHKLCSHALSFLCVSVFVPFAFLSLFYLFFNALWSPFK